MRLSTKVKSKIDLIGSTSNEVLPMKTDFLNRDYKYAQICVLRCGYGMPMLSGIKYKALTLIRSSSSKVAAG